MSLPIGIIRIDIESGPVVTNGQKVENTLDRIKSKGEQIGKQNQFSSKIMATSLIGLGTAAFSVYQGFDQLEKLQLRAEKTTLAVARAQKQVNDLQRNGKTNTEAYALATEKLRISQEQASIAADDVNQQIIQLGLSSANTGANIATMILKIKEQMAAHSAAGASATGHATSNAGLTLSFRGLTIAMMSNPLGLALVAISVGALAIYSTNLGGIKDKVDGLIGSFGGVTTTSGQFHSEVEQKGVPALQQYSAELEGVAESARGVLQVMEKEIFSRALSKDSTLIGSVESYKQLDSIISNASNEMKTMLKFEKDTEGVIKKIVEVKSVELEKLGIRNQFLERRLRLEQQIGAAQERRIKREREESKKR